MVFGTVAGPAVGILASALIERFDLTRADIGRLSALYALVGAAVSPFTGRLADRFGGRRMVVFTFLGGAVTFLAYSAATSYALLLVAAALSGVPNGSGNQATNRIIATRLSVAERGLVTGVKQSGVQLGRFLAGLILPSSVLAWGMGRTYLAMALLAVAGAGLSLVLLPADAPATLPAPGAERAEPTAKPPLPAAVWWLTGYALLLGAAAGATGAFTALFGEQELGMTRAEAGLLVGLTGGAAVVARILLSGVAQRAVHYGPPLAWLALGAAGSLLVTARSARLGDLGAVGRHHRHLDHDRVVELGGDARGDGVGAADAGGTLVGAGHGRLPGGPRRRPTAVRRGDRPHRELPVVLVAAGRVVRAGRGRHDRVAPHRQRPHRQRPHQHRRNCRRAPHLTFSTSCR